MDPDNPYAEFMNKNTKSIDNRVDDTLIIIYNILLRQYLVKKTAKILKNVPNSKLSRNSFEDERSGDASPETSRSRVQTPFKKIIQIPINNETSVGLSALNQIGGAMKAQINVIEDAGTFISPLPSHIIEENNYSLHRISKFKAVQRSIYSMEGCRLVVTVMKSFNEDSGLSIETPPEPKKVKPQKVRLTFKKNAVKSVVDDEVSLKEQLHKIKTITELGTKMKEEQKFDFELRDSFIDKLIFAVCKELIDE